MKKNPCDPKCPKRSSTCHSWCKDYLDFYADCRKANDEQQEKNRSSAKIVENASYARYAKLARKAPKRFIHTGG